MSTNAENTVWEPILDARLVAIYNVDIPTLKANRQGRMTPAQKTRLQQMRLKKLGKHAVFGGIALVLVMALSALPGEGILTPILSCLRLILGAVVLIQLWLALAFFWRSASEIATGKVKMYPGRLHKISARGWLILYCERGEFYNVPRREWDAFEHHARYRIFCTPHTKIILAAQPVHPDEPLPEAWSRGDDHKSI